MFQLFIVFINTTTTIAIKGIKGMREEQEHQEHQEHQMTLDEALSAAQRIKRRAAMRRAAPKIRRGREKASRRKASSETLMRRARNRARKILFNRLAKSEKGEMTYAARQAIEKKLSRKKTAIDRLAKKLYKDVKKDDRK